MNKRKRKPQWAQSHHHKPERVGGKRERSKLRAAKRGAYA